MDVFGLPTCFGPNKFGKESKKTSNQRRKMYGTICHLSVKNRVDNDVQEAFSKNFKFFSNENASVSSPQFRILPESSLLFQEEKWMIEEFQDFKNNLNTTKGKLNDLNLRQWHSHTSNTNTAGDVIKKIRYSVSPEFLTQAWCKMYECLYKYWLVPKTVDNSAEFNSVHLCEAPGAFITALNHFLHTWHPDVKWDWLATTLNPYHESNPLSHMIPDDRFILHTLQHWDFGEDGTGDLMNAANLRYLSNHVKTRLHDNVMLVTADGSIDCQINPAEQEALVAPLHYCETLTALNILQPGGSLMLKMFTLLECDSICLLYLLACTFQELNVSKPAKSKEGNSEVYVICNGYHGQDHLAPWMPTLMSKFGPVIDKALFRKNDIPHEFIQEVFECAKFFTDLQIKVIERNLQLFFFPNPEDVAHTRLVRRLVAERYIEEYELQPIDPSKVIVGNSILSETPTYNIPERHEEGSFNDRLRQDCLDKTEHLDQLWTSVQSLGCQWHFPEPIRWFMFNKCKLPKLQLTFGEPLLGVKSSKFCNNRLLDAYNKLSSAKLLKSVACEVEVSKILDASQWPWETCNYRCHQLLAECVSAALQDLQPRKSLCVRGLPLLTQFTVAFVFMLGHSFSQVGLSVEGNIILCGYQLALDTTSWLDQLLVEMHRLPGNKAILSLVPINILCDPGYHMEDKVSFYLTVFSINNARLLRALEAEVKKECESHVVHHSHIMRYSWPVNGL